MDDATKAPLKVRTVGRGDGPAILLCHGFGAPGDDLVALAREVDAGPGVRWFFPEAPLAPAALGGGRAWWMIDIERRISLVARGRGEELRAETPPGLAEARAALEQTIAALEREHGVKREKLIIGGFSQGAMLTTEVALHAEQPFAGLCDPLGDAALRGALDRGGARPGERPPRAEEPWQARSAAPLRRRRGAPRAPGARRRLRRPGAARRPARDPSRRARPAGRVRARASRAADSLGGGEPRYWSTSPSRRPRTWGTAMGYSPEKHAWQ